MTTPHRDFNVCEGFVGVPETGKTCAAVHRVIELGRTPCYLLAHDVAHNIPDQLPGGLRAGVVRHSTIASMRSALVKDARGLHCFDGDAEELVRFAEQLAASSLKAGGGRIGVPVVLYFDEVVMATNMSPRYISPAVLELVTQRRHKHIGVVWTTQSPSTVNAKMMEFSTTMYFFRVIGKGQDRMRDASIPDPVVEAVGTLENHSFVVYRTGSIVTAPPQAKKIA